MKRNMHRTSTVRRLGRALSFVLPAAACSGYAWAQPAPDKLCNLDRHAVIEQERVNDASDLWSPAIAFTRVQVQGMPEVYAASNELSVDFPQSGSQLQFFYTKASDNNDGPTLVGCLRYTDTHGQTRIRREDFESEGGRPASIAYLYTTNLGKGLGPTLFLAVKWPTEAHFSGDASGWLYELDAFGKLEESKDSEWNELTDLLEKIGDQYGLNGVRESKRVTYPYKDQKSLIKRLRALGYLR